MNNKRRSSAVAATILFRLASWAWGGEPVAVVSAGEGGFGLRSSDGAYVLKLTGYLQLDGRFFAGDDGSAATSTFTLRRVRPILQGTVAKIVDFNLTPDFGGGSVVLQDAYLEVRHARAARLRLGKFKTPFGLERLQSARHLALAERALPTAIAPNRDVGVQLGGDLSGGAVSYAVGVFNGVVDGGSGDRDTSDGKDVAARVFLAPFKRSGSTAWKGLGLGVAWTSGSEQGALPGYKTSGQVPFFAYAPGVVAAGTRTRWSPQASYERGPFRAFAEYAVSRQWIEKDRVGLRAANAAWETTASFVLTGESSAGGAVTPRKPVGGSPGGAGAIELVVRVHALRVDDAVFQRGFADRGESAGRARAWAVGVSWYPNRNLKYFADYERTTFAGSASGAARGPESLFLFRAQVAF